MKRAGKFLLRQGAFELGQISADHRLQIRVQRGRGGAFELADFRQHLMRGGKVFVRPDFRRGGECAALVLGVGVRVDEDDRQRLRAALAQRFRRRSYTGFVDRRANGAVGERTLIDFHAQVAIGDRDELAPQAPGLPAVAAAHFQHVAKAARGDHADPRAAPFQQRVGADGGAVHDRAEALDGAEREQALQKTGRFIAALRRHLGDAEGARHVIEVK